MKTESCPLGDKIKLKYVLKGDPHVCLGHFEKENGIYLKHKACTECPFFDSNNPGIGIWPPYTPTITTTPGEIITTSTYTTTSTQLPNGHYVDENGNEWWTSNNT
jgi:hypothetical protein